MNRKAVSSSGCAKSVKTIHEKRERVLVFTQFKEMTGPLSRFLATIFNREGLVLHGSVPVGKRKELVEKFQGRDYVPFFVLSLKAGRSRLEPYRCQPCHPLRPLVEPGGRESGHRSGLPHWSKEKMSWSINC